MKISYANVGFVARRVIQPCFLIGRNLSSRAILTPCLERPLSLIYRIKLSDLIELTERMRQIKPEYYHPRARKLKRRRSKGFGVISGICWCPEDTSYPIHRTITLAKPLYITVYYYNSSHFEGLQVLLWVLLPPASHAAGARTFR